MKGGSLDENGVSWYLPHREAPVRLLSFSRVTSRFFIRTLFLAIHSFISPTSSANLDSFLTFFHSSHSSSKRNCPGFLSYLISHSAPISFFSFSLRLHKIVSVRCFSVLCLGSRVSLCTRAPLRSALCSGWPGNSCRFYIPMELRVSVGWLNGRGLF